MKLIIGLGNPEPQYDSTRHNIGFWALDRYAVVKGLSWKRSDKFRAHLAEYTQDGEKVILAKPATYYNLVGESARSIVDFYKIASEDILVIHDDLALPLGTIRTRVGGSDGGNNGLKSLSAHIGESTHRLRIGVWTDGHDQADKVSVVLGKLSRDEQQVLTEQFSKIDQLIDDFVSGTLTASTHRTNSKD